MRLNNLVTSCNPTLIASELDWKSCKVEKENVIVEYYEIRLALKLAVVLIRWRRSRRSTWKMPQYYPAL